MKWVNHSLLAASIGAAVNAPLPGIAAILIGSTLPDRLDFQISMGSRSLFNKVHRGITHWPWLYMIPFTALYCWPGLTATIWGRFVLWVLFGSLLHILGDSFTPGGVPYLPHSLKKKGSLGLFRTGSGAEFVFTWTTSAALIGAAYARYALTGHHRLLENAIWLRELQRAIL